jgi:hypothetical protein
MFKRLDFVRLFGVFSTYCLKEESFGASESLFNGEMTREIIKSVSENSRMKLRAY